MPPEQQERAAQQLVDDANKVLKDIDAREANQNHSDHAQTSTATSTGEQNQNSDVSSAAPPSASRSDLLSPTPDPQQQEKQQQEKKNQDCAALLNYRDTKLDQDFEVAITQRDLYITQKEEEFTLAKETLDLVNDGWWVGKLSGGNGEAVA